MMERPDQERFDLFARHLEVLDAELGVFCARHLLRLERNLLRQPCRVLRREGNPEYLIEIGLSDHWLKMSFTPDLCHDVSVFAYYTPTEGDRVWRKSLTVVKHQPFSVLRAGLHDHLLTAVKLIAEWKAELIIQTGVPAENLRKKYGLDA